MAMKTKDEKDQRAKTLYLAEMAKVWGDYPKMMKHFEKSVSGVYELTDGKLFAVNKPEIKTRFCFGYGYCGISTEAAEAEAEKMRERAANDVNYFMRENLASINEQIEMLESGHSPRSTQPEFDKIWLYPLSYTMARDEIVDINIWNFRVCLEWKWGVAPLKYSHENETKIECSEQDRALILLALYAERDKLSRRLQTYLKRYGLDNVRAWTFICD